MVQLVTELLMQCAAALGGYFLQSVHPLLTPAPPQPWYGDDAFLPCTVHVTSIGRLVHEGKSRKNMCPGGEVSNWLTWELFRKMDSSRIGNSVFTALITISCKCLSGNAQIKYIKGEGLRGGGLLHHSLPSSITLSLLQRCSPAVTKRSSQLCRDIFDAFWQRIRCNKILNLEPLN